MPTNEPRNFDLNIEKILEGWEIKHAIREMIANALDEQVLSNTKDITISTDRSGNWHIRDFGRGIHYENLTHNENLEKQVPKSFAGLVLASEGRSCDFSACVVRRNQPK